MKLHEAIAVTYAAMGQELSDAALTVLTRDLQGYPLDGVLKSLSRCRKELRRLTLADVIERIPGGRPGAEEAWSIVSKALNDERATVVWTQEIASAFSAALGLQDDPVAARMAFKEVYTRLAAEARDEGKPIVWTASLGHDPQGREGPLLEAVRLGRLPTEHVAGLLPHREVLAPKLAALVETKQIAA